jgi:ubiquinone/menaquinone biosynthesis C-methylase UbiE
MKEIEKEGVPANIESTISFIKEEINPSSRKSGRLFDQDLNNKEQVFLDIGCGIGRHLLILRNNGIRHAFGFDIVPNMVKIARKEFNLRNLFVANALRIPLSDGSVDRCFFYNAIEHCSVPEKALEEIHRILSKDGILYVDIPNARSMGDRIFRWGGKILYGKTSHIQKFTRKRIESLVEKIGFGIQECKVTRGIFVDFPQVKKFTRLKRILKFLFDKEVNSWELKLAKKD